MFDRAGTSCSSASGKEINGGKTAPATLPSSDKTGSTLPAILNLLTSGNPGFMTFSFFFFLFLLESFPSGLKNETQRNGKAGRELMLFPKKYYTNMQKQRQPLEILTFLLQMSTNGSAELLSKYNNRYSETILAFFSESSS